MFNNNNLYFLFKGVCLSFTKDWNDSGRIDLCSIYRFQKNALYEYIRSD